MDLGLATALATGAGVYWVYGDKGRAASAAAIITGIALYVAYYCKLKSNPILAAAIEQERLNNNQNISTWNPLSFEQINDIKNLVNSNPIQFVAEP